MSRPRRVVHRGQVQVAGWLLDVAALGEARAQARVLDAWRPGMKLARTDRWLVITLDAPLWRSATGGPGEPLLRHGAALIACPPPALAPPSAGVWAVDGGALVRLDGLTDVDPAAWVSLDGLTAWEAHSLAAPPPPPSLPAVVEVDLRARTGRPVTAEARGLMDFLEAPPAGRAPPALLVQAAAWWTKAMRDAPGPVQAVASWFDPVERLLSKALRLAGFAPLLAGLHRRALARLMEELESGDLDEALRRAIPLGAPGSGGTTEAAVSLPGRRDQLTVTHGRGGSTSVLGQDVYNELRRRYRATFERLDRAGRVDDAFFVLAELLRQSEEAVLYLEKHGRLREAAEFAEARELAPGLIVRLWFAAGEIAHAVDFARAHGAFRDAVDRLSRLDPHAATLLRRLWAAHRAAGADWAGAVALLRDDPNARQITASWCEAALAEAGAHPPPGLLVDTLCLFPERFDALRPLVLSLFADDASETLGRRISLYEAFERLPPAGAPLARAALRACVRDAGVAPTSARWGELQERLRRVADSGALSADLPRLRKPGPHTPMVLRLPAPGRERVLTDVCALPNGDLLVARGEAGLSLLSSKGALLHHFDVPAHRVVANERGGDALALARRGELTHVSRVDLRNRRTKPWIDLRLDHHADHHDGDLWYVLTRGRELLALDLRADRAKALWRVDLQAPVTALSKSDVLLEAWTATPAGPERWRWELPTNTLRERRSFAANAPRLHTALAPGPAQVTASYLGLQAELRKPAGLTETLRPCTGLLQRGHALIAYHAVPGGGLRFFVGADEAVVQEEDPAPPSGDGDDLDWGPRILGGQGARFWVAHPHGGLVHFDLARRVVLARLRVE